jgi:hypothetical protein
VDQVIVEIHSHASGEDRAAYYAALLGETPHPDFLVDLVIDEIPNDEVANESEPSWGYYFVNHSERCPFWLHPLPASQLGLWDAIQGSIEKGQLSELFYPDTNVEGH